MITLATAGPDELPSAAEIEGFRSIRRSRRRLAALTATALPVAAAVWLLHEAVGSVVAVLWALALTLVGWVHGWSRCPRCGELCFGSMLWQFAWLTRCVHCDSRLYWSDEELFRAATHGAPLAPE